MDHCSAGQPVSGPFQQKARVYGIAVGIALVAATFAGFHAWREQQVRTYPLELDGWGYSVMRLQESGHEFGTLFREPSLWRGPVVPFLFGLCYYLAPFDESVLIFNVAVFAVAAGLLFLTFCYLGARRLAAAAAVLGWVFYLPHARTFGYYFAEPTIVLFVVLLLLLVAWTVQRRSSGLAFLTGAVAGVLLLCKAPFLVLVGCLPFFLAYHLPQRRGRVVALFTVGLLLTFTPWTLRNWLAYHEFIPFTVDGGKVLFQGSYLPGDDVVWNDLREIPEFAAVEKGEAGMTPVEQSRYWRALALAQIRENPLGQARLCVRKALRFWMYLPAHSWVPTWKTGLVAAVFLPLAFLGLVTQCARLLVQLCALWAGGLWFLHAVVHAELRYNFTVMPMMFLLAVLGFGQLAAYARRSGTVTSAPESLVREPTFSS